MKNDAEKFLKKFSEFMKFCREEAPDTIEDQLKACGYDPAKLGQQGRQLANDLYEKQIQKLRGDIKTERMAAQKSIEQLISRVVAKTAQEVDNLIQEIVDGRLGVEAKQYAQAHFKNFSKATLEDKRSLLRDIELLKHLTGKKKSNGD
jgi:hypothetical protein